MRNLVFVAAMLATTQAFATIKVSVDIGSQRMHVYVNGALRHTWLVSTGRGKYGERQPDRTDHSALSALGTRANTTVRRCPIPSSFVVVMRYMAPINHERLAGVLRMVVCG